MGCKISKEQMNEVLNELSAKYKILGPKWDRPHKNVRFLPFKNVDELVLDRQSDFSVKEAFYPISQVMFYFKADDVEEAQLVDDRDILIFARACDINSVMPLDKIFCCNGEKEPGENRDFFYSRLREKVKFALIPCESSFDNCFCLSTGTNQAESSRFSPPLLNPCRF